MDRKRLTKRILIALALGIVVGTALNEWVPEAIIQTWFSGGIFHAVGTLFMRGLLLLVVPVVFVSLTCGVASLGDLRQLGRIGVKAVAFYLFTTCLAISLALAAAVAFGPGKGFDLGEDQPGDSELAAVEAPSFVDVIVNLVPSNPIEALAQGEMLQIIVFSIIFGVALIMAGSRGERIIGAFRDLNEVVMKIVQIIMWVAPYGVFCLIAAVFADEGFGAIRHLAQYFFLLLAVLLCHAFIVYPILLKLFSGLSPLPFIRKIYPAQLFAFSTASSNATIPVTLTTVRERLGVSNKVSAFTVPLGATINMDGTAMMQGVATVFIAQAFGFDLSLTQYLMVILTATMASIGTAGVPGVGTIMLAMVLTQAGLPVEGIALILGVDRLLDMVRTAVNITGDSVVTCIIGKSEGSMDLERYHATDEANGIET